MSLRDEMPQAALTFCGVKVTENEEISYAVKTFLAQGGKITVVPPCVSRDSIEFNKTIESKRQAEAREEFKRNPKPSSKTNGISITMKKHICEAENKAKRAAKPKPVIMRPENRAKSGRMNIHKKGDKHVVTIKSMHIGTYDDEPTAIKARDDERRRLRLPEAAY